MARQYSFVRKVQNISADTGTNNLDFENEHADRIYHITGSAVMNDTTDYDRLSWGIVDSDEFHIFEEEITPLKDVYYTFHEELVLTEGQSYRAELQGCTAADDVRMFLRGWWEQIPKKGAEAQEEKEAAEAPEEG